MSQPLAAQEIQLIAIGQLHFDPQNPRLPVHLHNRGEGEVLEYMLLECDVVELMLSIGQQGFFQGEPLLVTPRASGGYTVVEGNRRLAALKLLQPETPAPLKQNQVNAAREAAANKPETVPVISFPERTDILGYLGYRHITGAKSWDSYAKARYLKQLRDVMPQEDSAAHQALAKKIGSRTDYVAKLLTGLMLVERAQEEGILTRHKLKEDELKFSVLTTALGYENIATYLGLESSTDTAGRTLKVKELDHVFDWLFDKHGGTKTVLGESRNLSKLARVVAHSDVVATLLKNGDLDEADVLCGGPLDAIRILMSEVTSHFEKANSLIGLSKGFTDDDLSQADRLRRVASQLHLSIKSSMESDSEEAL